MRITRIKIKNFKSFKNAIFDQIPKMSVILGANGSGKSTFFDVFAFLKDAMLENVTSAFQKRGGFNEVRSRNSQDPIEIEIKFREKLDSPLITYYLKLNSRSNKPFVEREILKYRRGSKGLPWHFLDFENGEGEAITNELDYLNVEDIDDFDLKREQQSLKKNDILAIKGLAQFERFKASSIFGNLIENWHVSDFNIKSARITNEAGYDEHLSKTGDNLAQVTQFLHTEHPEIFNEILKKMSQRIPGINDVSAITNEEGRIVHKFKDKHFEKPFLARYVSDGTIKMFAYLVLLYDPEPHPLLCIEEPENQLYHSLLDELSEELRAYSERGQVMVTTHSPDFLNSVNPHEVFLLIKKDGFSRIKKASEIEIVRNLIEEGDKMGYLWKQGFLNEVDPA